jgi:hypothetical protein
MVRLRLQCAMWILLGSTGFLMAQQQKPQQLPQGRLPKTPPQALTSTQPGSPATNQQQSPQITPPATQVPASQNATSPAAVPGAGNAKARATNGKPKPGKTQQEVVQVQQAPPRPPTLDQLPAQAPQVRFAGGLLTVEAKNSTLGDVLSAIRRQTGASLELPPSAASERVMAHLGPAQPREVLASLLNGSDFDYVILGSLQRPGGLEKIILTARQNQTAGAPAAVAQNPNGNRPGQQAVTEDADDNGGDAPDREVDTASEPEPETPAPAEQQQQPAQQAPGSVPGPMPGAPGQPAAAQPQAQPEGEGGQQQQQVKTPEQLLRELQQMRQQQQQQQQNQGEGSQPQDTPNNPPQ